MTAAEIRADLAPNPASYMKARRRIVPEAGGLRALRLAVLSTYTANILEPFLFVEAALRGLKLESWFGPFGQLEQPALEDGGELYQHAPDVVLVLAQLDDLLPGAMPRFLTLDAAAQQTALGEVRARLSNLLATLRARTGAILLVANFPPPAVAAASLADAGLAASQTTFTQQASAIVADVCRGIPAAFVFDYARLVAGEGLRHWEDARLRHLARVPFGVPGQIAFAKLLARTLRAAVQPPAKVLVLDLDETLWGGIVGEDGPGGIQLGDDYPGSVFKDFHRYILSLRDRGILLAIASKNNEADVEEVFATNRECLVKRGDFSAVRINWERKSVNIAAIASELNLGLDAFVFFDDNPAEREEVRVALPMVRVIEVPDEPIGYIAAIEESGEFDTLSISAEDRTRAGAYQALATAADFYAASPEDFLRSLDMKVTVGPVDAMTLPRVVQLLGKTNQFNLTTRRHSEADVQRMIAAGAVALWVRAGDRFGDHGLIAVAIAVPEAGACWRVDSLLMSCRVIGRCVETVLLAQLSAEVARRGGTRLIGEYVATPKNAQVATFYPDNNFAPAGAGKWERDIVTAPLESPSFIRVEVLP